MNVSRWVRRHRKIVNYSLLFFLFVHNYLLFYSGTSVRDIISTFFSGSIVTLTIVFTYMSVRKRGLVRTSEIMISPFLFVIFRCPEYAYERIWKKTALYKWYVAHKTTISFLFIRLFYYVLIGMYLLEWLANTNYGADQITVPNALEVFLSLYVLFCIGAEIGFILFGMMLKALDITIRVRTAVVR